jgi:hypothetical protein
MMRVTKGTQVILAHSPHYDQRWHGKIIEAVVGGMVGANMKFMVISTDVVGYKAGYVLQHTLRSEDEILPINNRAAIGHLKRD